MGALIVDRLRRARGAVTGAVELVAICVVPVIVVVAVAWARQRRERK